MGLTHFAFGVSSFGVPLPAGGIPALFNNPVAPFPSRYLFVDPVNGSDGYTGLDTQHAKATIAAALVARLPSDAIILAPGTYVENLTINRYYTGVSNASGGPLWIIGTGPRGSVG